jgi:hypothetical protein
MAKAVGIDLGTTKSVIATVESCHSISGNSSVRREYIFLRLGKGTTLRLAYDTVE